MIYIYTLKHPITNEVRYVGQTSNPKRRLNDHLYRKTNDHKGNWIRYLLNNGLKPVMDIIEECEINSDEREIYWISRFNNLTNSTSGGMRFTMTDAVKEKLKLANSGENNPNYGKKASKKTIDKLKAAHINRVRTKQHNENIKAAMNKRSCIIDDIIYESTMDASRKLNIPSGTICSRLNNKNFVNYNWK